MRKLTLLLTISLLMIGFLATPSNALSENADKFLLACRSLDAPFPPKNWDRYDLRDAALEVLNAIEKGKHDEWPLDFCLKALGSTRFPEDIPRITAYEKKNLSTVLRSLSGFPHPTAINFLLKHLGDKEDTDREVAIQSLGEIDFKKLEKSKDWKLRVLSELRKAKQREKVDWLIVEFDEAIQKIEKNASSTNSNSR